MSKPGNLVIHTGTQVLQGEGVLPALSRTVLLEPLGLGLQVRLLVVGRHPGVAYGEFLGAGWGVEAEEAAHSGQVIAAMAAGSAAVWLQLAVPVPAPQGHDSHPQQGGQFTNRVHEKASQISV